MSSPLIVLTLSLWSLSMAAGQETTISTVETSTYSEISNQELLDYDYNATEMTWTSNISFASVSSTVSTTIETPSKQTEPDKPTASANLTTLPPSTVFPTFERKMSEFCSCDVTSVYCDINCCCDADCDDDDRKTFNFCSAEPMNRFESDLCFSRQFIYANNTRLSVTVNEKGLFCISRDNLPERTHFSDQKVIVSPIVFNKVWHRKQHFTWHFQKSQPIESFSSANPYKYGTPVWRYMNSSSVITHLAVPVPGPSMSYCKSTRILRFLENFESNCLIKLTGECEFSSVFVIDEAITLVMSPLLVNTSNSENFTLTSVVDVRLVTCQNEFNCQTSTTLPNSEYNKTAAVCSNVPKQIHLTVYHNGTRGIVDAEVRVYLDSVKTSSRHLRASSFEQRLRVTFEWASAEDTGRQVVRRSGTPGYLEGRPILSSSRESVKYEGVDGLFSLPRSNSRGECTLDRRVVRFKHNIRTQCDLKLRINNEDNIHEKIWTFLFGNIKVNSTDPSRLELYISTFGDPEQFKPHDWVPVHLDNFKPEPAHPHRFSTGVSLTVVYAMIGPFNDPQAKIIGAVARMFDSRRLSCSRHRATSSSCSVKLSASVNFVDSSKTAVSKFARAPVVKIRLPRDFFYPFSSKSHGVSGEWLVYAGIALAWAFVFPSHLL